MIKIQSTQPTFTELGNIIINGRGFDSTKYYKLNFINSYNNISITKTDFIISENITFEKLIFTKPEGLILNKFYKVQVEEYNTDTQEAVLIQVSNIAVIKYITEPNIEISYENDIITINGTNSAKLKQAQIIVKAGNIELIKTDILYPKNNTITYPLTFIISAFGNDNIEKAIAHISYETIDGYQQSGNVDTLDIQSITNYYEYMLQDNVEILVANSNQTVISDDEIDINADIQRFKLQSYEKEQAYINLSNYINDNNTIIYKKFKDIIVNNNLSYGLWYQLPNTITYDKNIRHHQIEEYTLSTDFAQIIYAQCDFDHMYLFDSVQNYCIKFNPKISGFKYARQESKVETIGGQYPFIFRNGNTNYREFQISGLISRLTNWDSANSAQRTATPDVNVDTPTFAAGLNDANIYAERIYREQFLDWLNNGEYKVFKSPIEGNMIVRLMNVSLTPEDKLGRVIYSFSANVVEIAEYNYENLKQYNLL